MVTSLAEELGLNCKGLNGEEIVDGIMLLLEGLSPHSARRKVLSKRPKKPKSQRPPRKDKKRRRRGPYKVNKDRL